MSTKLLEREAFTVSRELEYFAQSELVTQTGYSRDQWWPGVITKELFDNGLDECENAGIAPVIQIDCSDTTITVSDNGRGITPDVVARTLDYSARTSDKAAYVSPTRGAQGNALKTVFAIPYVLNQGAPATVLIRAAWVEHTITIEKDHVAQRPQITHETQLVKTAGTAITIHRLSPSSKAQDQNSDFLPKLLFDYGLFNPHACFALCDHGTELLFEATDPTWRKWLPSESTSIHWYGLEQFETLILSYIARERTGTAKRTVRDFVAEFRGLSGTAKRKEIAAELGLDRAHLTALLSGNKLDRALTQRLLDAMQAASTPELLGVLGDNHFRRCLDADDSSGFRYKRITGSTDDGLPYVVEASFLLTEDPLFQGAHVGLNWSVPITNPLLRTMFDGPGKYYAYGLSDLLSRNHTDVDEQNIGLFLHLACPRFAFTDKGKGSLNLDSSFGQDVARAVLNVTERWAAIQKQRVRQHNQTARRMEEEYRRERRSERVTIKDAVYEVMAAAYAKASGNGQYPANARQVMYAARGDIQEMTGQDLDDKYFTQTLLPDYVNENPDETSTWDVVYDARGHLIEPHTNREIALGTLGVRNYLGAMRNGNGSQAALTVPEIPSEFPTYGPHNRYQTVLYIEKEGFLPLLQQAQFAERYDMAIMSSKGMGTTALRTLVEELSGQVKILVLHDLDKAGLSIAGTLTRDTRRYRFSSTPIVIDVGLRLRDVRRWRLQDESFTHKTDPTDNLALNGATPEEIEFLRGEQRGSYNKPEWHGHRVELNAFTSDQFVEWLTAKLSQHKVRKVIPEAADLDRAYRRAFARRKFTAVLQTALPKVEEEAQAITPPADLKKRIQRELNRHPELSWDEALERLLEP